MGFWGTLGKIGLGVGGAIAAPFTGGASLIPTLIGAGGAAAGAISQGQAHNRGEKFGGQLDMERALIERELMNQQSRKGAWQGLLSAQHVANPGPRPQLAGKYSVAPRQATGAELTGADALTQEVLARLQAGPGKAQIDPNLLNSGIMEKLLGYGSLGASAYGAYKSAQQPPVIMNQQGNQLARILAQSQAPRV